MATQAVSGGAMPLPRRRASQDVHAFALSTERACRRPWLNENSQPQACRYGFVARSPVGRTAI